MTKQQKLEEIRLACVKANPSMKVMDCGSPCHCHIERVRDVTLQDILLATQKKTSEYLRITGYTDHEEDDIQVMRVFDLTKSVDDQDDETIEFIHGILHKNI